MFCKHCGEQNPDEAVFCKNCGARLKEEVKKTTVIEHEDINKNSTYQGSTNTQTTNTSSKDDTDWKCCCGCLIAIFIIFALASMFH